MSVAQVNGVDISRYTYQEDLALQRQALSERLGSSFDASLLDSLGIKQRVLDSLIDNQLLNQYTTEQNFRISDHQLKTLVQNYPSFQVDGKFNMTQYEAILRSNGFSPQGFEQYQRVNEAVNQLREGISESAFVTEFEQGRLAALQDQSRVARYALIPGDQYVDEITVSEEDIQNYYQDNQDKYKTEERIKVEYVELGIDTLASDLSVGEDDIVSFYEETKGKYKTAESRQASHILISVDASATEEERQSKRDLAVELLEQAQQGSDFAELAKQHSDDPGSAQLGGDLGTIAKGQMVKPFEDAVFSMEQGDIQGPVETRFGYHIIKLTSLSQGTQQTLEQVREQIEKEAKKVKAENLFAELAESFKNLVFEDPDNLSTTADELDLTVKTSDWFTRDQGDGIASEAMVRSAAFADDVLNDNLVSQAIELGFDRLVAVQKVDHEAVAQKPLESVKQEITDAVRAQRSHSKVKQLGEDWLQQLQQTASSAQAWDSFIEGNALEPVSLANKRNLITPDLTQLGTAVFTAAAPAESEIAVGGLALDNGDYALYILESVTDGDPETMDEAQLTNLNARLSSRDGREMFAKFNQYLRDNAEVVVYQDQL